MNKIKSTRSEMLDAIRVFNAGGKQETIIKLLNIDELQYYIFIKMMLNMMVYYEDGGVEKAIPLKNKSERLHSVLQELPYSTIDEDTYGGGIHGKLPEFTILSESDETVGNFKRKNN